MGFEPRSVRQIDDAGGDVIDGGISVVAGDRGRTAERRRERKQRASAARRDFPSRRKRWRPLRRSKPSCSRRRLPAPRRRPPARTVARARTVSGRRCDCRPAQPGERPPRSVGAAWRAGAGATGALSSGGRGGGSGTLSPISGPLARRRQGRALGLRGRRNGRKRLEARQRDRREGSGRSGFEARHLRRSAAPAPPASFRPADRRR